MYRSKPLWLAAFVTVSMTASVSAAEGFLGRWKATIENPRGTNEVVMEFKGTDEELQATWTDRRGKSELEEVKVSGGKLTFRRQVEFQGNSFTIDYEATVDGDVMNLKMTTPRGEREFTAKRVD